jgi:glycosyltransferase involved in cell wall biosynthesis
MSKLLQDNDLREELVKKGVKRASHYSWERTSEQYLELYEEACDLN